MKRKQPNPGSPEAVSKGCTCPVMDNNSGRGYRGAMRGTGKEVVFVMVEDCPLHGKKLKRPKKTGKPDWEKLVKKGGGGTAFVNSMKSNSMIRRIAVQDPGRAAAEIISLCGRLADTEKLVEAAKDIIERARNIGEMLDHTEHWDKEGNGGATCPKCIEQRRSVRRMDELLDIYDNIRLECSKVCGESKEVAHGMACCELVPGHKGPHKAFGGWKWESENV